MGDDKILKNDFKVTILSLGSGSSRFTYERAFSPRNSVEYTLGIIGWGWNFINSPNPEGFLVKYANKWTLIPQKNSQSWLAGMYLKPELVFAHFNYVTDHATNGGSSFRHRTTQAALMGEIGYQLVLWGWFDFDIYAGIGPSLGTGNYDNYYHSFILLPSSDKGGYVSDRVHWAVTSGFRVGIAF